MAIKKKIAKLQNLSQVTTFIEESGLTSEFFNIADIPSQFPIGKSSILIMGSRFLREDVVIKMELLDSAGNPVYLEPVVDYSESGGVRVSLVIYDDVAPGTATLTILGELEPLEYGETIPAAFTNKYNIKHTVPITINTEIANDRPIRFFKRPKVTVQEVVKGQLTTTNATSGSNTQSLGVVFGDPSPGSEGNTFLVDRAEFGEIATYTDRNFGFSPIGNYTSEDTTRSNYSFRIDGNTFKPEMVGGKITISSPNSKPGFVQKDTQTAQSYTSRITKVINANTIEVQKPFGLYDSATKKYVTCTLDSSAYSIVYPKTSTFTKSVVNFKSFADIQIKDVRTFSGDVNRVAAYTKNNGPYGNWSKIIDTPVEAPELLVDENSQTGTSRIGRFTGDSAVSTYWNSTYGSFGSGNNATLTTASDPEYLSDSLFVSSSGIDMLASNDDWIRVELKPQYSMSFEANTEYVIRANLVVDHRNEADTVQDLKAVFHLSGSAFGMSTNYGDQGYGRAVGMKHIVSASSQVYGLNEPLFETTFTPDSSGTAVLQMRFTSGHWHISDLSVRPNSSTNFSPEYIRITAPVPPLQRRPDRLDFAFEFYDVNNNKSNTVVTTLPDNPDGVEFNGENLNILGDDNSVGGSLFLGGDATGSGVQMGGVNSTLPETGTAGAEGSGFIRSVRYQGFTSASQAGDNTGFMIYSGSVLPDSGDNYAGVGLELVGESGSLRFGTKPSRFEVIADAFFVGSTNTQFISGSGGVIEISSSAFHLTPAGDVKVSGSVTATSGDIGGWQIINNKLSGSNATLDAAGAAIYKSDQGPDTNPNDGYYIDFTPSNSNPFYVRFGPDFAVSSSGRLIASGALIEGVVTASGGLIANWVIGSNTISKATGGTFTGLSSVGDTRIFAGASSLTNSGSAAFNVKSNGDISGSQVLFTGGKIGGFVLTDSILRNANNTVELSSTLPGLKIKDAGGTSRVEVKSGSLSTIGGGAQYVGNKSFEEQLGSLTAGRNFVGSINSWSFSEGGAVNVSLTDRNAYADDEKAVSGRVTVDVVVPAGSGNYSSNNTYELSQIVTASISQGDTLSFSSVARFSSSFGGKGKDRALGPQYFRVEYWNGSAFVPFLPANEFTASNGYGEYFLGSGQYASFGASAEIPASSTHLKLILTGSINDDSGFTIEKPLFVGDKGTVNSDISGRKFTKTVVGSASPEYPETEITFDNFSLRSNTRKVEMTQEGLLIYNSEDSFLKMTGAGIEFRGGSGLATFGQSINRESFTNDSQIAGTLAAPALQAYASDPEDIGTTASDGNVGEFAKGNHRHRLTSGTLDTVLASTSFSSSVQGRFVNVTAGTGLTGGGSSGTITLNVVGGSGITSNANDITVDSTVIRTTGAQSLGGVKTFSDEIQATGGLAVTGAVTASTNISASLTGSFGHILINGSPLQAATGTNTGDVSLAGSRNYITLGTNQVITVGEVDISDDTNLATGNGITLSGDTLSTNDSQIVHDNLSGFVANEHVDHSTVSISAGSGLTGGGTILANRTIHVGAGTGITVNSNDIATNDSEIVHDNLSGFVANEHIDHSGVSITAGSGLTGGGTIAASRTLNIGAGTGVTVNANDIAIGQAIGTGNSPSFAGLTINGASIFNTSGTGQFKIENAGTNAIFMRAMASDEIYFGSNNTYQLRFLADGSRVEISDGVDFIPYTDSSSDLGTTSNRWNNIFTDAITVTNNITVGGTVDGRNISTDGTKLDGIAANADNFNKVKIAGDNNASGNDVTSGQAFTIAGGTGITTAIASRTATIGITADSVGDAQLAFNTGQHLTTTSNVTFDYVNTANDVNVGGSTRGQLKPSGTYAMTIHKVKHMSFNWNADYDYYSNHGIASTDESGNFTDDMTINSFDDIHLKVDTNSNDGPAYVNVYNNGTNVVGRWGYDGSNNILYHDGNITVTGTVDGRDVASDGSKLDGIESGATADQSNAEIRTAVEAASDSNVFTDADHSKLNAIEASATADQTAAEIRTLVESASDSNVFTDADHSKLNGIEASATADQTITAGSGLTGGGTGDVTLNIGAGTGIDVAADAISVDVSDFMTNGSNNRILTATGADAMNAEASLVFDGTNLGIGTTSPDSMLEVYKDVNTNNAALLKANINYSAVALMGSYQNGYFLPALSWATGNNSAGVPKAQIRVFTDSAGSKMYLGTSNNYSSGITNDAITIDASGNVGIGTTSPIRALDVVVASGDNTIRMATASQAVDVINLRNADGRVGLGGDVITVNGSNVGIGETSPSSKLQVKVSSATHGANNAHNLRVTTAAGSSGESVQIGINTSGTSYGWITAKNIGTSELPLYLNAGGGETYFGGNVGIGTASPAQKFHVYGASDTFHRTDAGASSGIQYQFWHGGTQTATINSNTTNIFSVYDGSASGTNVFNIKDGGNVGIGTTSPATKLHLADSSHTYLTLESTHASTAAEVALKYSNSTTSTSYWWVGMNDANTTNYSIAYGTAFSNGNTKLLIDGAGNVGIGATSPVGKLDVVGTQTLHLTHTTSDDTDKNAVITSYQYDSGTETEGFMMMQSFSNSSTNRIDLGGGNSGHNAVEEIRFFTAANSTTRTGTQRLHIDNNGNVGIGTTSPDGKLHVHTATAGSITPRTDADDLIVENSVHGGISILTPDDQFSNLIFGSPSDNRGAVLDYSHSTKVLNIGSDVASGQVAIKTAAGTEAVRIDASGNVGIGDTSPDAPLDIEAASDPIMILNKTGGGNSAIHFQHAGSAKGYIYVDASQNMHFGNSSVNPTFEITAAGNILVPTGYIQTNTVNASSKLTGHSGGLEVQSSQTDYGGIYVSDTNGDFVLQLYGSSHVRYGFLATEWGSWDLRKEIGGVIYTNNQTTYYLQPESTSNFNIITTAGNITVGAQLLAGAGSATAPSISFSGDTNTGIYNDGSNDNLKFTTAGVDRAFLSATQFNVTGNIVASGTLSGTTLNTGQGANELYAMNQNVRTTDDVTFGVITINDSSDAQLLLKGASNPYIDFYESTTRKAWIQFHSDGNFLMRNNETQLQYTQGTTHAFTGGNATFSALVQLSDGQQVQWGGGDNAIFGSNASDYVAIKTNSTDRLTINSSGTAAFAGLVTITDTASNSTGILTITGNNAPSIKFNTPQDDWLIGTHYAGSGHDFSIINTTLSKKPLIIVNDTVGIGGDGSSNGTDPTGLGLIIDGSTATFSTDVIIGNGESAGSVTYASGFTGEGWRIDQGITEAGKTSAAFDNLVVRGTMSVYELQISQIRATNGNLFISSTGKADAVSESGGTYTITVDSGSSAGHGFAVNDIIRMQQFDNTGTGGSIVQSDLTVTGVTSTGSFTATLRSGTTAPQSGNEYVRLGNTSNTDRQGGVYLTADDSNAPFIDVFDGVTAHTGTGGFNSSGTIKTRMGKLSGITSPRFGALSGYGLWASGSVYLEGNINATTGNIGGWGIGATAISSSDGVIDIDAGAKRITITDGTNDRIYLGEVTGSTTYGLKIFDGSGVTDSDLLVELGSGRNQIVGWDLTPGNIVSDNAAGSVRLSSTAQALTIWTGSVNEAQPKLVVGKLPLHDGTVDTPYGFAVFSGAGTVSGSEASASVLITANKARVAGWELTPGKLSSGTVAKIDGNNATIALGTGATTHTSATPQPSLFFVSASSDPIFFVGENFSYVNDTLTAAGWTLDTESLTSPGGNVKLAAVSTTSNYLGIGTTTYAGTGIFVGQTAASTYKLSAVGTAGKFLWDNSKLEIQGSDGTSVFQTTSTGATIGGWNLNGTSISSTNAAGGSDGGFTTAGITLNKTGYISAKEFNISSAGSATFKGAITGGSITIGSNAFHVDSSGNMWWGSSANYAGATIRISAAGVADLSGANISGDIIATHINTTSGSIANFTIASTGITSNGIGIHPTGQTHAINAGSGQFSVTHAGAVVAQNATVTGDITANNITTVSGSIADWKLAKSGNSAQIITGSVALNAMWPYNLTSSYSASNGADPAIPSASGLVVTDSGGIPILSVVSSSYGQTPITSLEGREATGGTVSDQHVNNNFITNGTLNASTALNGWRTSATGSGLSAWTIDDGNNNVAEVDHSGTIAAGTAANTTTTSELTKDFDVATGLPVQFGLVVKSFPSTVSGFDKRFGDILLVDQYLEILVYPASNSGTVEAGSVTFSTTATTSRVVTNTAAISRFTKVSLLIRKSTSQAYRLKIRAIAKVKKPPRIDTRIGGWHIDSVSVPQCNAPKGTGGRAQRDKALVELSQDGLLVYSDPDNFLRVNNEEGFTLRGNLEAQDLIVSEDQITSGSITAMGDIIASGSVKFTDDVALGVGTDSPESRLHIVDTVGTDESKFFVGSTPSWRGTNGKHLAGIKSQIFPFTDTDTTSVRVQGGFMALGVLPSYGSPHYGFYTEGFQGSQHLTNQGVTDSIAGQSDEHDMSGSAGMMMVKSFHGSKQVALFQGITQGGPAKTEGTNDGISDTDEFGVYIGQFMDGISGGVADSGTTGDGKIYNYSDAGSKRAYRQTGYYYVCDGDYAELPTTGSKDTTGATSYLLREGGETRFAAFSADNIRNGTKGQQAGWGLAISGSQWPSFIEGPVGIGGLKYVNSDYQSNALHVTGDILATGNITAYSDVRHKDNIKTITGSIDIISDLRGVKFNWTKEYQESKKDTMHYIGGNIKRRQIGMIAQEVEAVLPELVTEDAEGFKNVNYQNLVAVLVEANKEQQKLIEDLQKRVKQLESK